MFRPYLTILSGNKRTNGTHSNSNDNNTTPMFRGLNKTTQKTRTPKEENSAGMAKELCSQIYGF
jgi:hypothetical protein